MNIKVNQDNRSVFHAFQGNSKERKAQANVYLAMRVLFLTFLHLHSVMNVLKATLQPTQKVRVVVNVQLGNFRIRMDK